MPELTQEQVKARAGASRPQPGSSRALCPWVLAGRTSQRHSQLPVQGRPCYWRILPLSLAWQTGVQFLLCPVPSLVLRTMAPDTLTSTSSEPTGTSHLACHPALSSIRHTDRSLGFWIFKSDFQSPLKTLQASHCSCDSHDTGCGARLADGEANTRRAAAGTQVCGWLQTRVGRTEGLCLLTGLGSRRPDHKWALGIQEGRSQGTLRDTPQKVLE